MNEYVCMCVCAVGVEVEHPNQESRTIIEL